ncbi:MurR/RpiR family transcriptional regulator [Petroclostridium sp. X23]|uniref:MurR/RpiR family transcriptional regulator n=1 Tax=Petroclostridium sp. X23 TaxID=3045146 RepID=UPI0024AE194B|nr:MurR/RpiR family transcriptional regulator [Petroclostridium sp. X23]WHH58041.1 MurR/RpiR family transcriptional regulator [Petroclostridium sp. X23]
MKDLVKEINNSYAKMTKSQKRVAKYILDNLGEIAFDTLYELAAKIGVSTTVIRFTRVLSYNGFTDFQENIQNNIKGNISLPERIRTITVSEKELRRLDVYFKKEIEGIEKTILTLSENKLEKAFEMILEAQNVYVMGLRTCFAPAFLFCTILRQIKLNAHLIQGIASTYPEEIVRIGRHDVCILFAYPRFIQEMSATGHSYSQAGGESDFVYRSFARPA